MATLIRTFAICSLALVSGCLLEPPASDRAAATEPGREVYSRSAFGFYEVASFDVYTDNDSVHLLLAGKTDDTDKQLRLGYTRSDDGGQTWRKTVFLNSLPATIASRGNDVQLAANGNRLLAIWQTKGELPGMGPMASAVSDDGGQTWLPGSNPAANDGGDQSHLDISAGRNRDFHVVWLEDPEENGYQSLRYAKSDDGGTTWSKAQTLDQSTCSCCWNTLRFSSGKRLSILYRDMKPRDMTLLQSDDNGTTWRRTSTAGEFDWQFDGCPHVGGSLATDGEDRSGLLASLVWTGLEAQAGLYFLTSDDSGLTWSKPHKLGNAAIHGDLSINHGKMLMLWDEMEPDGSGLFYSKTALEKRALPVPTRLAPAASAATHPRAVATRLGFLAIWTEKPEKHPGVIAWRTISDD